MSDSSGPGPDAAVIDPFNLQVKRWIDAAGSRADQAYTAIVLALVARVKELTPVKTGNLRANWTVVRLGDALPREGSTSDPVQVMQGLHHTDSVVIVNPVVYARRIEYGFVGEDSLHRHYNQAGAGMLQQTIAEAPQIARRAVQQVISGRTPSGAGQ